MRWAYRLRRLLVVALIWVSLGGGAQAFHTVVIDAGHGGHDRGGIPGQRVSEKGMTLDVAQRLEQILKRQGFRTVMTRRSDVFVPLGTRVSIANAQKDAIFVSIHFNSARRVGARGFETFYYTSNSLGLARRLHNQIIRTVSTEDRGVKHRGFYVIRRTRIPSVLLELGFLTNPSEARLVSSSAHRQRLAERIARGIVEYRAVTHRGGGGVYSASR